MMHKLGRAGVPMEVMGLMLGEFMDEYTVRVVDVFTMPQSGTGESVEVVDHVFQSNMLNMLKQTERPEMVVGWYHSHPGFGCFSLVLTVIHSRFLMVSLAETIKRKEYLYPLEVYQLVLITHWYGLFLELEIQFLRQWLL